MHLGTTAQVIGQVTFSVSYVVVIIRGRLASIGPHYEEAARDLGATPVQALRLVLLPILAPAILASLLIVFALSIDDFVVTQYMSSTANTTTIPMFLYSNARGGTSTPALNALATILLVSTLAGLRASPTWSIRSSVAGPPAPTTSRRSASCRESMQVQRPSIPTTPEDRLMAGDTSSCSR